MARVLGIASQAAMLFTFLKVYGIKLRLWQMVLAGVLWLILEVFFGYLYVKFNLLKMETDFMNKNNPFIEKFERSAK